MITTFTAIAAVSLIAMSIAFIPLTATLIIPLLAYLGTPTSLTAAWAAWGFSSMIHLFQPALFSGVKRATELVAEQDAPVTTPAVQQPVPTARNGW